MNTVNMIGCLLNQLAVSKVAYDDAHNPNKLPFTALVDMGICQEDASSEGVETWYVSYSVPSTPGDGLYKTFITFMQVLTSSFLTICIVLLVVYVSHTDDISTRLFPGPD